MSSFDQTKRISFGFGNGSFQAGITSLVVTDLTATPEPGGTGLIAAAGIAIVLRRLTTRN